MKQAEFDDKVIALQVQFEKNREELKDNIHYALYHWHTIEYFGSVQVNIAMEKHWKK